MIPDIEKRTPVPEPSDPANVEFSSFDRLTALLLSVPKEEIQAKLADYRKRKGNQATPEQYLTGGATEVPNRKDPD
jgi:hypothetical protein